MTRTDYGSRYLAHTLVAPLHRNRHGAHELLSPSSILLLRPTDTIYDTGRLILPLASKRTHCSTAYLERTTVLHMKSCINEWNWTIPVSFVKVLR